MVQGLLQDSLTYVPYRSGAVLNALSIDVEDYFMVSAFEKIIRRSDWKNHELRVEKNTRKILNILDECGVRATFFVVGWIAECLPDLVREIHRRGHEVGCHSYSHELVYNMTPEEFRADIKKAKKALECLDIGPVLGFRAPSFSIVESNLWAIDILKKEGFRYDASIFPAPHARGGMPKAFRYPYWIHGLAEFPMSTANILGRSVPFSGGGYLRLFPYSFIKYGMNQSVKAGKPSIVYLHPWEFDPQQPRIKADWASTFKHYVNLHQTEDKFRRLLRDFYFAPVKDVLAASIGFKA